MCGTEKGKHVFRHMSVCRCLIPTALHRCKAKPIHNAWPHVIEVFHHLLRESRRFRDFAQRSGICVGMAIFFLEGQRSRFCQVYLKAVTVVTSFVMKWKMSVTKEPMVDSSMLLQTRTR